MVGIYYNKLVVHDTIPTLRRTVLFRYVKLVPVGIHNVSATYYTHRYTSLFCGINSSYNLAVVEIIDGNIQRAFRTVDKVDNGITQSGRRAVCGMIARVAGMFR